MYKKLNSKFNQKKFNKIKQLLKQIYNKTIYSSL